MSAPQPVSSALTGPVRYVALGDSFTEGVGDDDPSRPHGCRGWADRVAEQLAHRPGLVGYANLAIRGRKLAEVLDEQVPRALELQPTLVSMYAGGNDILRPNVDLDALVAAYGDAMAAVRGSGAELLVFTAFDVGHTPLLKALRGRFAIYNELVREAAARHQCRVVDFWRMRGYNDPRYWAPDRIHMSPAGHHRMAAEVLTVLRGDGSSSGTYACLSSNRPGSVGAHAQLRWATTHAAPWLHRRLTGRSSGDGLTPRFPELTNLTNLTNASELERGGVAHTRAQPEAHVGEVAVGGRFVGLDLGWSSGGTGVAVVDSTGRLLASGRVETDDDIATWLSHEAPEPEVVAIDAPLVVPNQTGSRLGERQVSAAFGRFAAGPYASSLSFLGGPPRAARLAERFGWNDDPSYGGPGACVEVYPHPALVGLFQLPYRLDYKKGSIARRTVGLTTLAGLLAALPTLRAEESPRWVRLLASLHPPASVRSLDAAEDELDAIICAHLAWLWRHDPSALRVYGTHQEGYIIAPPPPSHHAVKPPGWVESRKVTSQRDPQPRTSEGRGR